MIKYKSLLITILLFTNLIFAQDFDYQTDFKKSVEQSKGGNNKKIQTYIHQNFKINYPKSWGSFETKFFEKGIVLRIARKNQINEVYIIPERSSKNIALNARVIPIDYDKETINKEYIKYINNSTYLTRYAKNQFNISVELKIQQRC